MNLVETKALVSVDEYLKTSYEPDCDYVDGELVERNVGEFEHSELQFQITAYLRNRYLKSRFIAVIEQRVQVGPTRFRIPDVCVARLERPMPSIFRTPPLIVIEILSPEDRVIRMRKRVDDYLAFGIPNLWVIDPEERRAFIHTREGSTESPDLILHAKECDIVLPLPEVFEALQ
jgi:Uma2 family endonuclease